MENKKPIKIVPRRERKIPQDVVKFVDHSISISKQINIYLQELGLSQKDLATMFGKKESEISKWLRGTHNFTLKTISKIEAKLNKDLILCPRDSKHTTYYLLAFPNEVTYKMQSSSNLALEDVNVSVKLKGTISSNSSINCLAVEN